MVSLFVSGAPLKEGNPVYEANILTGTSFHSILLPSPPSSFLVSLPLGYDLVHRMDWRLLLYSIFHLRHPWPINSFSLLPSPYSHCIHSLWSSYFVLYRAGSDVYSKFGFCLLWHLPSPYEMSLGIWRPLALPLHCYCTLSLSMIKTQCYWPQFWLLCCSPFTSLSSS